MTETRRVPDITKLYDGMAKIHSGLCMLRRELDPDGEGASPLLSDLEFQVLFRLVKLRGIYGIPAYHGERMDGDGPVG